MLSRFCVSPLHLLTCSQLIYVNPACVRPIPSSGLLTSQLPHPHDQCLLLHLLEGPIRNEGC